MGVDTLYNNYSGVIRPRNMQTQNTVMLDFKRADINGDGIVDNIYLMGSRIQGSGSRFADNITLFIQNGRTNNITRILLESNAGYDVKLYVDDFVGGRKFDIMVRIDSGGSAGLGYFYIYSIFFNNVNRVFNYREFNQNTIYDVSFRDNYKVEVKSQVSDKTFWLDISYRSHQYLDVIYDKNGKLRAPVQGYTTGLVNLVPIDLKNDGVSQLVGVQRIVGRYNADTLGFIDTVLTFKKNEFIQESVQVGITSVSNMENNL